MGLDVTSRRLRAARERGLLLLRQPLVPRSKALVVHGAILTTKTVALQAPERWLYQNGGGECNRPVQSIHEIRRIRLRQLIAEVWDGSTGKLTEAMGWQTASFASRLVSDSPGNQKNIGGRMARDIEKAAGKPRHWLDTATWMDETAIKPPALEVREQRPPMFSRAPGGARAVPVVGQAIANPIEDGYFDDQQFPVGAGEGYIRWPTRDPQAYAVQIRGDSMAPRIRHGEYAVVEPNTAITPGEDVVVRTRAGRKMVKRLLYQRGKEVALGSINERHPTLTLSLEEIESIHFVGGIAPRTAKEEA